LITPKLPSTLEKRGKKPKFNTTKILWQLVYLKRWLEQKKVQTKSLFDSILASRIRDIIPKDLNNNKTTKKQFVVTIE